MNQNPWHVESMAQYERGRIQQEMKQIRLEEEALKGRVRRPGLLQQARLMVSKWLSTSTTQAAPKEAPPAFIPSPGKRAAKT